MKINKTGINTAVRQTGAALLCNLLVGGALLGSSLPVRAQLAISGHVAYNLVERDSEDDLTFQRNGYSESRFKLSYTKALQNGMGLEVVQEIGIADGEGILDARRQEVGLSGDFGGIWFGQGYDAGDDLLNGDLSGTAVIQPIASQASALDYPSDDYDGFDPGRGERLRYDSPLFGDSPTPGDGATVSAQLGNDDEIEIGFRLNSELEGGRFRVGAFLTMTDSDVDSDSFGILLAYAIDNGLNFAVVVSSQDNTTGTDDGDFTAIKVGYKTGPHAFSVVIGNSENPGNPVETDSFGLAYVFLMEPGIELYAAFNEFDSDDDTADEDFLAVGTRVKF